MKKFSDKMQKKLINFYANQNKQIKCEIHLMQKNIIRTIKDERNKSNKPTTTDDGELFLHAFISGIYQIYRIQNTNMLKANDDLKKATELRIKSMKKEKQYSSPIKDKVIEHLMPVIIKLREENYSWQAVSDYIAKYHKKRISRTYLHAVYNRNKSGKIEQQ